MPVILGIFVGARVITTLSPIGMRPIGNLAYLQSCAILSERRRRYYGLGALRLHIESEVLLAGTQRSRRRRDRRQMSCDEKRRQRERERERYMFMAELVGKCVN